MTKKILIVFGYSVLLTILIVVLLFLTKGILLDKVVDQVMRIRGTSGFEGEEKAGEVWNIIIGMIIPVIFFIALALVAFFRRNEFKNR